MKKTRILITGGSGLLGSKLVELSEEKWNIFPTYHSNKIFHKNAINLKLEKNKEIEKIIKIIQPNLIIHTAAITDIDWAESHFSETFEINVNATKSLISCAKNIEADFFYISTDSVFDGEKGWYDEKDAPNPINAYSKTKFEAEKIVAKYEQSTIIRTSFYGFSEFGRSKSYPIQVLEKLKNKIQINAAVDKINNPLFVSKLVESIYSLYEKNTTGIFHVASTDYMDSYEFAQNIAKNMDADRSLINKISFKEILLENSIAKRPLNLSLNTKKAQKFIKLPTMKESIEILCKEYKEH